VGAKQKMDAQWRPAVWMILVTALLDLMAMGIVMPVLPVLIEEMTGSLREAGLWTGLIASLWAVMQFFCAPVLGALSDRFGRRPVILVSTAGLALDWVLMALAPNLWWLVVGRIIGGATSASGTVVFAYMADITEPEGRTRAFGLVGAAIAAGFVAGPALGGILGEFDARLPFWVAAGLSAAAFVYGFVVLPESLPAEQRQAFTWRRTSPMASLRLLRSHGELALLASSTFLLSFTHRIFTAVYVLYAGYRHGLGTGEIGMLLALSGLLDVVVQGALVSPVANRFGQRRTVIFGLVGGAIGLVLMGMASTPLLFALAMIPTAAWGFAEPTLKAMMSERVSASEQGQMQGAVHSVVALSGIAGPIFFGWVYGMTFLSGPGLVFYIGAGLVLAAAWWARGGAKVPAGTSAAD
jgi:MFS transporter, DHA1 family, tetracycline resistance protein